MEFNPWSSEKPEETAQWSSDHDHQISGQISSSYPCNFCKRGFSNAQALGGHMNVHRKDRAKLKEEEEEEEEEAVSLQEYQTPVSAEKINNNSSSSSSSSSNALSDQQFSERPCDSSGEDDAVRKLNLFSEMPSSSRHTVEAAKPEMRPAGSSKEDLDLELRLGFKSRQTSSRSEMKP